MSTVPTYPPFVSEPPQAGPVVYVWEQEDVVITGDIHHLIKAIQDTHYSDLSGPHHVITFAHNAWKDVTIRIEYLGADDNDWMTYELTCSWDGRAETALYTIDGRA